MSLRNRTRETGHGRRVAGPAGSRRGGASVPAAAWPPVAPVPACRLRRRSHEDAATPLPRWRGVGRACRRDPHPPVTSPRRPHPPVTSLPRPDPPGTSPRRPNPSRMSPPRPDPPRTSWPVRGHRRWAPPDRSRGRAARRRLLGVVITAAATLATALAWAPGAAGADVGHTGGAHPGAEGDGGALALWIVAEVVVLVLGVAALRLWTDHRTRRHGRDTRSGLGRACTRPAGQNAPGGRRR